MIPAPGCVLIKPLQDDSVIASADKNYNRMGEVIKLDPKIDNGIEKGDIICFDEYAYRRFNYQDKEYCVVDISNGGLWGVIKHVDTTTEPVQNEGLSPSVPPL